METGIISYHTKWKSIHYFPCGLEIPLSKVTKPRTYMNHDSDETQSQNPSIPSAKNNRFNHTDLFD